MSFAEKRRVKFYALSVSWELIITCYENIVERVYEVHFLNIYV